jgi:iron complex transport system substrate-binding protein
MVRFILLLLLVAQGCDRSSVERQGILAAQRWDSKLFAELPLPELEFTTEIPGTGVPHRIVSFIPSVTEIIFVLGLGDRLVGRCHWCDWPREVLALPDVGGLQNASQEVIVDLRPDLVVLFRDQVELAGSLRDGFGLRVLTPATEETDRIDEGIRELGVALGVPERAEVLVDYLAREMERVAARWRDVPGPRTLVVLDRSSLWVPGRTSFLEVLLETAGAVNVAASLDTDRPWPSVSLEKVLEWRPEVILDLGIGKAEDLARGEAARFWSGLSHLDAVRNGRVLLFQSGVLVRPGPRMAAVAEKLGEILHELRS